LKRDAKKGRHAPYSNRCAVLEQSNDKKMFGVKKRIFLAIPPAGFS
jgi:hypothetical protein